MKNDDTNEKAPFSNYQEEAHFWDTHNVLDLMKPGTKPVVLKDGKKAQSEYHGDLKLEESLNIRFSGKDLKDIRLLAREKGLGPTTLVRMWAKERLQQEQTTHRSS